MHTHTHTHEIPYPDLMRLSAVELLSIDIWYYIIKGNVAVYKVLNLEMLLYKVRWHVSTVKECNLIARS